MLNRKKGVTLVEVAVALALITIVFAGTVDLITKTVHFAVEMRERTVGTALAQEVLNQQVQGSGEGCTLTLAAIDQRVYSRGNTDYVVSSPAPVRVKEVGGNFVEDAGGNFLKVSAEVTWDNNIGDPIKVDQIVRKKN